MKSPTGMDLIQNPRLNKGTAFTKKEREEYKLRGLLPDAVTTLDTQKKRVLNNIRRKKYDIERYIFLSGLQNRNERLFYRVIIDNIKELMPIIYTPTVGQACQEFAHIFRQTRGIYITQEDKGFIKEILASWTDKDIRLIVVTDGERILGLGDLGANGMGIPIGKLSLYCACAGIQPDQCLPVTIDVGTNNDNLRNDPLYLGVNKERTLSEQDYLGLVDEFVSSVQEVFPLSLIQFEDFLTPQAYKLLNIYKEKVLCFNDDIQGTAAVALAGVYATTRISGVDFKDLRVMFLGSGSAATGIGDLIYAAFLKEGVSPEEAKKKLNFINRNGLVVSSQDNLAEHVKPYAQNKPSMTLEEAIKDIQPHVLIGATGSPGAFTENIIKLLSSIYTRPAIFALSNPTSHAECTAEQAYAWSKGKAIFASGSPFSPVIYENKTFIPGQGNNAYVFPGLGLGAIACAAKHLTDDMFLAAARTLSNLVTDEDLDHGSIYPDLTKIREVSLAIAIAVAEVAYSTNIAQLPRPSDLSAHIKGIMYNPEY